MSVLKLSSCVSISTILLSYVPYVACIKVDTSSLPSVMFGILTLVFLVAKVDTVLPCTILRLTSQLSLFFRYSLRLLLLHYSSKILPIHQKQTMAFFYVILWNPLNLNFFRNCFLYYFISLRFCNGRGNFPNQ